MKVLFQCEICGETYESPEEARTCEALKPGVPKVAVGDLVYIEQRYPIDEDRPFLGVKVVEVEVVGHSCEYLLEVGVMICKDGTRVGIPLDERARPLRDEDFGSISYLLGDTTQYPPRILSLELVVNSGDCLAHLRKIWEDAQQRSKAVAELSQAAHDAEERAWIVFGRALSEIDRSTD